MSQVQRGGEGVSELGTMSQVLDFFFEAFPKEIMILLVKILQFDSSKLRPPVHENLDFSA